ncbi:cupredoxin domain-containing protein [Halomicrococcus gelatinilyticus]|uniref:hypothetical protein n=1 Tax=Halomicrococcus gelatinilyticus TaxID=1702103 RepID=UPI002E137D12
MTREDSPKSDRRSLLRAAGAVAGVGVLGSLAGAQDGDTETTATNTTETNTTETTEGTETGTVTGEGQVTILGGRVDYWLGLEPRLIERTENPNIDLDVGSQHRVVWVNLDGARHQFQIIGERGGEDGVVLAETEPSSQRGEKREVTFQATDRMRRYRCRFHPDQMRGNITFGGGGTATFTTRETDTTRGTRGTDGFTDTTGTRGTDGFTDTTGTRGTDGFTDTTGTRGTDGFTDTTGTRGTDGFTDTTGTRGTDGFTDTTGTRGTDGFTDTTGTRGTDGFTDTTRTTDTTDGY